MKNKFIKPVFVWLIYLLIQFMSVYVNYPGDWHLYLDTLIQNILYIVIFYLVYYSVFKAYSIDKQLIVAIVNYCLCFVIALFSIHFLFGYLMPVFGNRDLYIVGYRIINTLLISDVALNYFQFSLYAFLFWQYNKRVITEKKLRVEQSEKFALANAKLKTEYDYLKSQINPHFLYNTLGFFYAKMLQSDKKAAEGIATLSDLMRYSITSGKMNGKVFLKEEVEQVEYYIALQQLRFNNELHIHFHHQTIPENLMIIPHSLITLVENAFKYGVTNDPAHPMLLFLETKDNEIQFILTNKISHHKMDHVQTGIGLENLRNRLKLEYPDKHQYIVKQENDYYTTILTIREW